MYHFKVIICTVSHYNVSWGTSTLTWWPNLPATKSVPAPPRILFQGYSKNCVTSMFWFFANICYLPALGHRGNWEALFYFHLHCFLLKVIRNWAKLAYTVIYSFAYRGNATSRLLHLSSWELQGALVTTISKCSCSFVFRVWIISSDLDFSIVSSFSLHVTEPFCSDPFLSVSHRFSALILSNFCLKLCRFCQVF